VLLKASNAPCLRSGPALQGAPVNMICVAVKIGRGPLPDLKPRAHCSAAPCPSLAPMPVKFRPQDAPDGTVVDVDLEIVSAKVSLAVAVGLEKRC
jgi:hypothetical protein